MKEATLKRQVCVTTIKEVITHTSANTKNVQKFYLCQLHDLKVVLEV